MLRKGMMVAAVAAVSLVLAACDGGGGEEGTVEAPEATGTTVAVALGETDAETMYMRLSQSSVSAGAITFTIVNEGVKEHEFEVFKTATAAGDFAIGPDDKVVDPEDAEVLAEVEGIEGGESETLTLEFEPGHYAMICNEEGHYGEGMFADFTVT
jgi:uncharacterized cupredoxin-like copper-binding protein